MERKYVVGGLAVAGLVWYSWFGDNRHQGPADLDSSYVVESVSIDYLAKPQEVIKEVDGLELIVE